MLETKHFQFTHADLMRTTFYKALAEDLSDTTDHRSTYIPLSEPNLEKCFSKGTSIPVLIFALGLDLISYEDVLRTQNLLQKLKAPKEWDKDLPVDLARHFDRHDHRALKARGLFAAMKAAQTAQARVGLYFPESPLIAIKEGFLGIFSRQVMESYNNIDRFTAAAGRAILEIQYQQTENHLSLFPVPAELQVALDDPLIDTRTMNFKFLKAASTAILPKP